MTPATRSPLTSMQVPGMMGIVPPYILDKLPQVPSNGGVVPPHLQPKPGAPANGGVVPPYLQPKPTQPGTPGNGGVVPPHLQPDRGVPGNTGIVPPYLQDRVDQARTQSKGTPALQTPAAGHVPTRQDPLSTSEVAPGSFGRCPPMSFGELARSPGGRAAIDAWFQATVDRANAGGPSAGSYDVEFFGEDNAWQLNFQGTGTWYQFDGNTLRVIDTEGERTLALDGPINVDSLIAALERA